MSPLACSLLALAALLAVTSAKSGFKDPDPFCGELNLGERTDSPVKYEQKRHGGPMTLPDKCTRPGNKLVGVSVSACNPPHSKPTITDLEDPDKKYRALYIDCPSNTYGCESFKVKVTLYCDMVLPTEG